MRRTTTAVSAHAFLARSGGAAATFRKFARAGHQTLTTRLPLGCSPLRTQARRLTTDSSGARGNAFNSDILDVLQSLPGVPKAGRMLKVAMALGVGGVILATCPPWCVVPAGHVGLLDFFGDVADKTLQPGFHLKNPLAKCVVFSTKTQRVETTASVPSREGLTVQLEVSALYRLDPSKVQHLYKTVGTNYEEVVLLPHFKSIIRELTSAHEAKGLYTAMVRMEISTQLTRQLSEVLKERGVVVDETPINGIIMPQRLVHAIEEKLRAEQEAERMAWVLQREEAEAKRKVIEAKGIADFQKIVTQGISEQLLRWKGIEATEKLATSSNAKMVVIGKTDGLPLVLAP